MYASQQSIRKICINENSHELSQWDCTTITKTHQLDTVRVNWCNSCCFAVHASEWKLVLVLDHHCCDRETFFPVSLSINSFCSDKPYAFSMSMHVKIEARTNLMKIYRADEQNYVHLSTLRVSLSLLWLTGCVTLFCCCCLTWMLSLLYYLCVGFISVCFPPCINSRL